MMFNTFGIFLGDRFWNADRYQKITDNLVSFGVPVLFAEEDAVGVEHHVSPETLAVFEAITQSRLG